MSAEKIGLNLLNNVPSLPGYSISDGQRNFGKPNALSTVCGVMVVNEEGLTWDKNNRVKVPRAPSQKRWGNLGHTTSADCFTKPELDTVELPAWDALDRHVLRFTGFYREAVNESNLENCRTRHVTIYYYLEDGTVHISEPKQDNSGLPQGTRVRRGKLPKQSGGLVDPTDLRVGQEFECYSCSYFITDCDKFTRDYYSKIGQEQPYNTMEIPSDTLDSVKHLHDGADNDFSKAAEKLYREKMLGGGCPNGKLGDFLKNDRQVLRFFAVMDDLSTPQYERRPFTVMYFLSDNTVEIRETFIDGCGRDNFPRHFKRAKMAINFQVESPIDPELRDSDCIQPHHFAIGENVSLAGSTYYTYDADGFTRKWYNDPANGQTPLDLLAADVMLPERPVCRPQTPPYLGFGSWDDSMASVLNLVPKVPQKDFIKLFQNDGKVLRFLGKFVNPKEEDKNRQFLFLYFLHDDTMMISEPPQRNSGIMAGRFLEKGVHMNQLKEKAVTQYDLKPGNMVQFNKWQFEMTSMDEYTRRYFEDDGATFQFNLEAVLQKLRIAMGQQAANIREVFRRFDLDSNGVVTIDEFQACLTYYNFKLQAHETLALMRHFDGKLDGQVSYNEFCDTVLDRDYSGSSMPPTQTLDKSDLWSYKEMVMAKLMDRQETGKVREAVRAVGACLCGKVGRGIRLMKECGTVNIDCRVSDKEIQEALLRMGFSFHIDDIRRTALYLGHYDLDKIDTNKFRQDVEATFHDMCSVR